MPELFLEGKPIGAVKGVLFDKDGTLSNSEDHLIALAKSRIKKAVDLFEAEHASLFKISTLKDLLAKAYGISHLGLSPEGTIAIGSRNHNLISTATVISLLGENWPRSMEMANEIFLYVDGLAEIQIDRVLLPGVLEILQKLRDKGVICALISNDTSEGIQKFLSINNLIDIFHAFWSADNQPPKPDPFAVKGLCNVLGLQPQECALIGDADSDLRMARQAGIEIAMGYIAGWRSPPQLTQHNHLLKHWDELSVN